MNCERCNFLSSNRLCKACVLLDNLAEMKKTHNIKNISGKSIMSYKAGSIEVKFEE